MAHRNYTPKLCHHKASGLAFVCLNGNDHYLGKYGSVEAEAKYHRKIAEWLASDQSTYAMDGRGCISIAELCEAYLRHAYNTYRKNGKATSQIDVVLAAIRPMVKLYETYPPQAFGPLELKACRQKLIERNMARTTINKVTNQIKRIFAWGGENTLVDELISHRLACVKNLTYGRGGRETIPRMPALWQYVKAVEPYVADQVWAMINLQWLTGMRSQNVVEIRTIDLDMTNDVWIYTPQSDKSRHRRKNNQRLEIAIGPKSQAVIGPWLRRDLQANFFQPIEAVADQRARMIAERLERNGVGSHKPKARRPRRKPGDKYDTATYRRAITRACETAAIDTWQADNGPQSCLSEAYLEFEAQHPSKAEIARWVKANGPLVKYCEKFREFLAGRTWTPHQLRHSFATRCGDTFNGEHDKVAAALGHANIDVTKLYAHLNRKKASDVARKIG